MPLGDSACENVCDSKKESVISSQSYLEDLEKVPIVRLENAKVELADYSLTDKVSIEIIDDAQIQLDAYSINGSPNLKHKSSENQKANIFISYTSNADRERTGFRPRK